MRLVFDDHAFEDLSWFVSQDPKLAKKIMSLIQEVSRAPFKGRGKPEPLKNDCLGVGRVGSPRNIAWYIRSKKMRSGFSPAGITIERQPISEEE